MTANRLHAADKVSVEIYYNGEKVDSYNAEGVHTVEDAVREAYDHSGIADKNIKDYVFRVTDLSDHTSARYRVNAGGNVKLIPEE